MREILYIQAGGFANHVGTHFWNTQDSYLRADDDDALVDHARSFRESRTSKGETIYTPRVLIFDQKDNFGNTASVSTQDAIDTSTALSDALWQGPSAAIRQATLPPSAYHTALATAASEEEEPNAADARYWSDFSRAYYDPRSFQRLPALPDADGREAFARFDADVDLMDEGVRSFIEECDLLQGMQLAYDTAPFGAFIGAMLSVVRDDMPKLSMLAFPVLGDTTPLPGALDVDDIRGIRAVLADALVLRDVVELCTLSVPVCSLKTWRPLTAWDDFAGFDISKPYFSSAVLSAAIESVTLPTRMSRDGADLAALCAQLESPLAQLSGTLPTPADAVSEACEFSLLYDARTPPTPRAQLAVTRGLVAAGVRAYEESTGMREPFLSSVHISVYPLPSSFPALERAGQRQHTAPAHAALSAGAGSAPLLRAYATFVDNAVRRNADGGGMDRDEMRELAAGLWTVHDGLAEEEGVDGGEGMDEKTWRSLLQPCALTASDPNQ